MQRPCQGISGLGKNAGFGGRLPPPRRHRRKHGSAADLGHHSSHAVRRDLGSECREPSGAVVRTSCTRRPRRPTALPMTEVQPDLPRNVRLWASRPWRALSTLPASSGSAPERKSASAWLRTILHRPFRSSGKHCLQSDPSGACFCSPGAISGLVFWRTE
jgi:hypothetical protein